jgi:hypothetical protein
MNLGVTELMIILAIVSGLALLVIGVLIGILIAVLAPRTLDRTSMEPRA